MIYYWFHCKCICLHVYVLYDVYCNIVYCILYIVYIHRENVFKLNIQY